MADSDGVREDAISGILTDSLLESVIEWKRINPTPSIFDASPTDPSLVVIRDYAEDESPRDSLVFPPANHENLPLSVNITGKSSFSWEFTSSPSESMSSSSQTRFVAENDDSSSSFSPSDSELADPPIPPPPPPPKTVAGSAWWWNFGIEILNSKVNGIVKHLQSFTSVPGAISSSHSPVGRATLAAAVLMFIYFRWRRRRRRLKFNRESREHLIRTVKEKDKRINQLLEQIAEMNKLLVALQRGQQSKPS